jgi:hypothetical protein
MTINIADELETNVFITLWKFFEADTEPTDENMEAFVLEVKELPWPEPQKMARALGMSSLHEHWTDGLNAPPADRVLRQSLILAKVNVEAN